jgi:hypothetical protein
MILNPVFLAIILAVAIHSKPIAKKPGNVKAAEKRTPVTTGLVNKVAISNPKAPIKRVPAQRPAARKLAPRKAPAAVPKPVTDKPGPASKPVTTKKPTPIAIKKPVVGNKPGTNGTTGRRAPAKNTPIQRPKVSPQESGQVVRSKSNLEAAMAYMKAQTPIDKSGDRKIEELLASPSEAQQVEPYNPQKFLQARADRINERSQWPEASKAQSNAAHRIAPLFSIISFVVVAILIS